MRDLRFTGLIQNRKLSTITGPEFFNAIQQCGWHEGTGTHFFQQLRQDGPSRGIHTPTDLVRAIAAGSSEPGRNGTTIHRVCQGTAYIVFNAATKTLITFSQGSPAARWNVAAAIQHLRSHAGPPHGSGRCAAFVRQAIEAGGLTIERTGSGSAKDYGPRLVRAGFAAQPLTTLPQRGDVAVIDGFAVAAAEGIRQAHDHGHMAMYSGTEWISDFVQTGASPYPGRDYERARPRITIYRYPR